MALNRPQMLAKAARHPSLADFGPAAAAANNATLRNLSFIFTKSRFISLFFRFLLPDFLTNPDLLNGFFPF